MNIEDRIVYTNITLGLGIVHRNALERLEDLSVTTPFTKETEKEFDKLKNGIKLINEQLEHYNFLLEKGYVKNN